MENTLFYHGTTSEGMRFTIAGVYEPNLKLGLSLCAKNDIFCKKTGRIRAEGRVKQKRDNSKGLFVTDVISFSEERIKKFNSFISKTFEHQSKHILHRKFNFTN